MIPYMGEHVRAELRDLTSLYATVSGRTYFSNEIAAMPVPAQEVEVAGLILSRIKAILNDHA